MFLERRQDDIGRQLCNLIKSLLPSHGYNTFEIKAIIRSPQDTSDLLFGKKKLELRVPAGCLGSNGKPKTNQQVSRWVQKLLAAAVHIRARQPGCDCQLKTHREELACWTLSRAAAAEAAGTSGVPGHMKKAQHCARWLPC